MHGRQPQVTFSALRRAMSRVMKMTAMTKTGRIAGVEIKTVAMEAAAVAAAVAGAGVGAGVGVGVRAGAEVRTAAMAVSAAVGAMRLGMSLAQRA